jgi:hypothetical protein
MNNRNSPQSTVDSKNQEKTIPIVVCSLCFDLLVFVFHFLTVDRGLNCCGLLLILIYPLTELLWTYFPFHP